MTHFIGAVLVPASVPAQVETSPTAYPTLYGADAKEWTPGEELHAFLAEALERFSENREVNIWQSKADMIAKARKDIEDFRDGTYAKWLKLGEKGYRADSPHLTDDHPHLEYLRTEFPKKLSWTDEDVYKNEVIKYEEPEDIRASDGAIHTSYNPDSKWDWWTIGGRWAKQYADKQGQKASELRKELEQALVNLKDPVAQAELAAVEAFIEFTRAEAKAGRATWQDIDAANAKKLDCRAYLPWWFPYSLVTKETEVAVDEATNLMTGYEWNTTGRMGWFGASTEDMTPQQWVEKLIEILDAHQPDNYLIYIDFHI